MDHGAGDATQPRCDSINGNDTASSDVVSLMGVDKDPAISKITKNIDNSVNDSSDNNVSVIVVDSGVALPSGVSNVFYSIEDVAGIVGGDVSDSHVASDEAVVTIILHQHRLLKMEPSSRVFPMVVALVLDHPSKRGLGLYLRWFCRETRSMPATVESCSTRSRQL